MTAEDVRLSREIGLLRQALSQAEAELTKAVLAARLSENQALDLLQEHGAVSDLCLTLADVAEPDCSRAIDVLRDEMRRKKLEEPFL